jgi:hypothetical protein
MTKRPNTRTILMVAAALTLGALVSLGFVDPATAGMVALLGNTAAVGAEGSTALTGTDAAGGQSSADGGSAAGAGGAAPDAAAQAAAAAAATNGGTDDAAKAAADAAAGKPPADGKGDTALEYTAFELPEGMELDAKASEQFTEIAKDLKLPQEAAQKLVSLYAKQMQAQQEVHAEAVKGWQAEIKADKDLGGDKLPESMTAVSTVMSKFGTPALKEYLDATGLGNHPELFRFVANVGKAMSEDTFVRGGNSTVANAKSAQAVYPNSNMNP